MVGRAELDVNTALVGDQPPTIADDDVPIVDEQRTVGAVVYDSLKDAVSL